MDEWVLYEMVFDNMCEFNEWFRIWYMLWIWEFQGEIPNDMSLVCVRA